ncbi:MAG: universal stress protein [Spirochaetota bacterium]
MFATALLPVTLHENAGRLGAMLAFLRKFDTDRVVLLYVTTGVPGGTTEAALADLRERALAAAREATEVDEESPAFRPRPFTPHSEADSPESGIGVELLVKSGSPALEITRTAWEIGAGFIYFPYKRKSWIQQTLVGSTTKDVIRLTSLPVFVFRQRLASAPDDPLRIVYPTAFGDTDREAVPYLQYPGLAAEQLILLHVRERAPDPAAERRRRETCDANLQRLSDEVAGNYAGVSSLQIVGNPRRAIPRVARRENAGLLVVGKSDRSGGLSAVMGSVAGELAKSAPCSVFIVSRAGAATATGETAP